jgi:threonine dehydrogenase-like Zn-dependent dehydrogenase
MKAAVVTPGKKDSIRVVDIERPAYSDHEVLVKVNRVGIDGTDVDINEGAYGMPPEGSDFLVIGHEAVGVVESVGSAVKCLAPGEIVVSTVRRPCWERCFPCRNQHSDMCLTGDYLERGIKGLHGYMSEYYVETLENIIRIPHELENIAVLLEPLSVAEKGIEQVFKIQERLPWHPKHALVMGAGPLGILATFILNDMGIDTCTIATRDKKSLKARICEGCGGRYVNVREEPLETLPKKYGPFDIIIEATGVSSLAVDARDLVNRDGAVCLLGVYPGKQAQNICTDCLNQNMVLNNKLVFGSVNSNRMHFERSAERMGSIEGKWPGLLQKLFTRTVTLDNVADGLRRQPGDIKVLVEVLK